MANVEVFGYSERGIINAFVYSCWQNEEFAKDWIVTLLENKVSKNDINNIKIYNEQSLSDFGDPDLIISFGSETNQSLVFIEAKVKTHNKTNWLIAEEYEKFDNKHPSNLFRQIKLKMELVKHKDDCNFETQGIPPEKLDERIQKVKSRKIGNNKIVKETWDEIKKSKKIYYVAIVPDTDGNIQSFIKKENLDTEFKEVHYISWEKLDNDFSNSRGSIKKTFSKFVENTFKRNKGQIY